MLVTTQKATVKSLMNLLNCTQIVLQKKLMYIIAQLQKKFFLERFQQNMLNLQHSLLLLP